MCGFVKTVVGWRNRGLQLALCSPHGAPGSGSTGSAVGNGELSVAEKADGWMSLLLYT